MAKFVMMSDEIIKRLTREGWVQVRQRAVTSS